jgi:hypothetical protein
MMDLPKPEVERCFFERSFASPVAAMELRWDAEGGGTAEQAWYLPESVIVRGSAPYRFGITVHRRAEDSYQVRIVWNRLCLSWDQLSRAQIMASSLAVVLQALGTDLWYLLNQPIEKTNALQAA